MTLAEFLLSFPRDQFFVSDGLDQESGQRCYFPLEDIVDHVSADDAGWKSRVATMRVESDLYLVRRADKADAHCYLIVGKGRVFGCKK